LFKKEIQLDTKELTECTGATGPFQVNQFTVLVYAELLPFQQSPMRDPSINDAFRR